MPQNSCSLIKRSSSCPSLSLAHYRSNDQTEEVKAIVGRSSQESNLNGDKSISIYDRAVSKIKESYTNKIEKTRNKSFLYGCGLFVCGLVKVSCIIASIYALIKIIVLVTNVIVKNVLVINDIWKLMIVLAVVAILGLVVYFVTNFCENRANKLEENDISLQRKLYVVELLKDILLELNIKHSESNTTVTSEIISNIVENNELNDRLEKFYTAAHEIIFHKNQFKFTIDDNDICYDKEDDDDLVAQDRKNEKATNTLKKLSDTCNDFFKELFGVLIKEDKRITSESQDCIKQHIVEYYLLQIEKNTSIINSLKKDIKKITSTTEGNDIDLSQYTNQIEIVKNKIKTSISIIEKDKPYSI